VRFCFDAPGTRYAATLMPQGEPAETPDWSLSQVSPRSLETASDRAHSGHGVRPCAGFVLESVCPRQCPRQDSNLRPAV
jgi:hypothetical protein